MSRAPNRANAGMPQRLRDSCQGEVPGLVPSPPGVVSGPNFSPDLARVVAAWDGLSEAIKVGILAVVQAVRWSDA